MCDRCGQIFSEREDGWTTMTGTTMRRAENGSMRQTSEQLDACPRCSGSAEVPKPTLRELLDDPWAEQEREARAEDRRREATASERDA